MGKDQHPVDKMETTAHNCYDKARALEDSLKALGMEDSIGTLTISTFFGLSRFAHDLAQEINQIEDFLEHLPREEKEK